MNTQYIIENENVYCINTYPSGAIEKYSLGGVKKYSITETETQCVYQWQNFNLNKGLYEDDISNNSVITVNGIEYTPINGQVIINKVTE